MSPTSLPLTTLHKRRTGLRKPGQSVEGAIDIGDKTEISMTDEDSSDSSETPSSSGSSNGLLAPPRRTSASSPLLYGDEDSGWKYPNRHALLQVGMHSHQELHIGFVSLDRFLAALPTLPFPRTHLTKVGWCRRALIEVADVFDDHLFDNGVEILKFFSESISSNSLGHTSMKKAEEAFERTARSEWARPYERLFNGREWVPAATFPVPYRKRGRLG